MMQEQQSISLVILRAAPLDRALHLNAANADETWPKLDQRSDKKKLGSDGWTVTHSTFVANHSISA